MVLENSGVLTGVTFSDFPNHQHHKGVAAVMRAKVTTEAIKMKDGLGFKVSLVITLQAKEQVLVEQITVGQLTKLH